MSITVPADATQCDAASTSPAVAVATDREKAESAERLIENVHVDYHCNNVCTLVLLRFQRFSVATSLRWERVGVTGAREENTGGGVHPSTLTTHRLSHKPQKARTMSCSSHSQRAEEMFTAVVVHRLNTLLGSVGGQLTTKRNVSAQHTLEKVSDKANPRCCYCSTHPNAQIHSVRMQMRACKTLVALCRLFERELLWDNPIMINSLESLVTAVYYGGQRQNDARLAWLSMLDAHDAALIGGPQITAAWSAASDTLADRLVKHDPAARHLDELRAAMLDFFLCAQSIVSQNTLESIDEQLDNAGYASQFAAWRRSALLLALPLERARFSATTHAPAVPRLSSIYHWLLRHLPDRERKLIIKHLILPLITA